MPRTSTKSASLAAPSAIASGTLQPESVDVIARSGIDQPPRESRINQIAQRAHEIYQARGGNHGKALEDWLQAEREIDGGTEDTES